MGSVADWLTVLIASGAAVVSVFALLQSKRHAEDFGAGSHTIAYREHVWFLHEKGLTETQIEDILRLETYRPDVPRSKGNAYEGVNGEGGLSSEIGSVAQILGPIDKRPAPRRELPTTPSGESSTGLG